MNDTELIEALMAGDHTAVAREVRARVENGQGRALIALLVEVIAMLSAKPYGVET